MNKFDYLIVGAGFYGAICAYELNKKGYSICVIDKRDHIGGNCYTEQKDGINIHKYGPHIFHTSNKEVWDWINQFANFNNFSLRPVANYKGEIYSLPFNMWTFSKMWGITHPEEAKSIIKEQGSHINEPRNLEEQAIKLVGSDVYMKLIKGYTEKQWRKVATELPKEIIERLPVRYTYDNNYFNDTYQGIPIGGYTQIFKKLLKGIDVRLGVDYFESQLPEHNNVIYTGPIDRYFKYQYGELEYKSVDFHTVKVNKENFQGTAMMNFTEKEVEHTRIVEHKHFEPSIQSDVTWITYEYPIEYEANKVDAYYPVNDKENTAKHNKYKLLADNLDNVYFGGRLAEYKYYDMHKVIESALNFINKLI